MHLLVLLGCTRCWTARLWCSLCLRHVFVAIGKLVQAADDEERCHLVSFLTAQRPVPKTDTFHQLFDNVIWNQNWKGRMTDEIL